MGLRRGVDKGREGAPREECRAQPFRVQTHEPAGGAGAVVFIPLDSVHFAVSEYICKVESPFAEKRHRNSEIEVLPVPVQHPAEGDCEWLMKLQRVPPGSQSWAEVFREFQHCDLALTPIRNAIKEVVARARERKAAKPPTSGGRGRK